MGLQFYINNITRCIGIVDNMSAMRQDLHLNTLIKCSTIFLQVDYLKTTKTFNKPLIFK